MLSPNAKEGREAADLEYESLLENETWDLVDLPKDRKAIGSRRVFKVKHHSDGQVERYSCKLVAMATHSCMMLTMMKPQWYATVLCYPEHT